MFNEDDELFGGSPEKKYFDILFNANRNLVEYQLTGNIQRIVVMEKLLEEFLDGEDVDIKVRDYILDNGIEVEEMVKNRYIADMGDILTQNE